MPVPDSVLRKLLDDANIGVWYLDLPSGQVTRNSACLGLIQAELAGIDDSVDAWIGRIHPADREEVLENRRRMIAGELDGYSTAYRIRRLGGGWIALRQRATVVGRDAHGKPESIGGLLFDMSRERDLEGLLDALFERPFQFIGLLTPEGVLLEGTRTCLRAAGHDPEDALGKALWEGPLYSHQPDLQRQLREGTARAAAGDLVRFEMQVPGIAGIQRTVDFTLTPLRDEDGNVVNIIPEGRDISDLAQTREALRAAEQRLSTATEAAGVGVWELDVVDDRLWCSDQWYRVLGLQPGTADPNHGTWAKIIHPDDLPRVSADAARLIRGEITEYRIEMRMPRPDGSWKWVLSIARATKWDAQGRVRCVAGILTDISYRRAIEDRLTLATEGGNVGLWDVQLRDGPVWVSAHWWSMLGYIPGEFPASLGMFFSLLHPADRTRVIDALRGTEEGRSSDFDLEFRMRCKDGSWRWIQSKGQALEHSPDGNALRITGVHIDVTSRKDAERRLAAAERIESVGRLAAGVAHEINTPVQYVNDSVTFVREGVQELLAHLSKEGVPKGGTSNQALVELQEELPAALDRMATGLARIAEIVGSMKEFSHPDHSEMTPVDLNRAIRSTLVVASNEYKHVADLETQYSDLPPITCYGGQINQVVLILLENAAHAIANVVKDTDRKGLITVRTDIDGNDAIISVSDTGSGIPEAIRHRVFEPFFTTKEVGRGSGQGLSVARNIIVQGHGGSMDFRTGCGKGTTFFVRLPIEAQRGRRQAEAA